MLRSRFAFSRKPKISRIPCSRTLVVRKWNFTSRMCATAWPNVETHNRKIDIILYHGPFCPDGFGAAFAAWKALGNNATYIPCTHGDPPPDVAGKHVAVFDFAFSRTVTQQIKQTTASFVLLDHHKSAMEDLSGEPNCHFNLKKSGARLAWEFFHPGKEVPQLILYVEDRDLWNWKMDHSKEFNTAMETLPLSFVEWDKLLTPQNVTAHIEKGTFLVNFKAKLCSDVAHKAAKREWLGKSVYVVNSTLFASEIGNLLAMRPDCDFALIWNFDHEKKIYCVSVRSDTAKNVDVSAVAKLFGGGGHPAASGFSWKGSNIEELFQSTGTVDKKA